MSDAADTFRKTERTNHVSCLEAASNLSNSSFQDMVETNA